MRNSSVSLTYLHSSCILDTFLPYLTTVLLLPLQMYAHIMLSSMGFASIPALWDIVENQEFLYRSHLMEVFFILRLGTCCCFGWTSIFHLFSKIFFFLFSHPCTGHSPFDFSNFYHIFPSSTVFIVFPGSFFLSFLLVMIFSVSFVLPVLIFFVLFLCLFFPFSLFYSPPLQPFSPLNFLLIPTFLCFHNSP